MRDPMLIAWLAWVGFVGFLTTVGIAGHHLIWGY